MDAISMNTLDFSSTRRVLWQNRMHQIHFRSRRVLRRLQLWELVKLPILPNRRRRAWAWGTGPTYA